MNTFIPNTYIHRLHTYIHTVHCEFHFFGTAKPSVGSAGCSPQQRAGCADLTRRASTLSSKHHAYIYTYIHPRVVLTHYFYMQLSTEQMRRDHAR